MPTDPAPDFPVVARFEIRKRCYLDEQGALLRPLPEALADPESIVALYRAMVLARTLDAKCVALNRQGRLGTYATAYGQEAVPIGVASAMRPDDILVPSYRENAALVWRGVAIDEVLSYYAGSERGSRWSGPAHDFPTSITVGGHALHAAGAAFALRYRGEHRAVACVFGDAATSKGDVYEAFNLAGVWDLPVVYRRHESTSRSGSGDAPCRIALRQSTRAAHAGWSSPHRNSARMRVAWKNAPSRRPASSASRAARARARRASSPKRSATCMVASRSTAEGEGIGPSAIVGSAPA